jgi:glutamine synthetase
VQTSDEQVVRLRRSVDALGVENDRMRTRQGDLESQIVALRELVTSVMGERFVRSYSAVKNKEYETFFHVISSWEREFLLLNV